MFRSAQIEVPPDKLYDEPAHRGLLARALGCGVDEICSLRLERRALDARGGRQRFHLTYTLTVDGESFPPRAQPFVPASLSSAPTVVVAGAGPAGLFAALRLLELGIRPIVLERGKEVRARRRDIAALVKQGAVDPDSNYCFGEGGAGTFSDGKLYTRSHKRGDVRRVLELLHVHGASEEVLIDTHPHVGTNLLPKVVGAISASIRSAGGEIHFESRMTGVLRDEGVCRGIRLHGDTEIPAAAVLLATGHSARDVFRFLHQAGIRIEAKPFAVGVRIEHPQALIDEIQYRTSPRHPNVPPATYSLNVQVSGRGVYSFCMCPGGIICPSATEPDTVVTNGWSPSKRNSRYANSGFVVETAIEDLPSDGPLAGLAYQRALEVRAAAVGGGVQRAPAQRLADFAASIHSTSLPECSYLPGIVSADMTEVLGATLAAQLRTACQLFAKKMPGFLTNEAVVVGVETRTSSPVRIPRDTMHGMHPQVQGLFPVGEGAGYAGGIVSAAMDGMRAAEHIAHYVRARHF